jgi:hypothetical protein
VERLDNILAAAVAYWLAGVVIVGLVRAALLGDACIRPGRFLAEAAMAWLWPAWLLYVAAASLGIGHRRRRSPGQKGRGR